MSDDSGELAFSGKYDPAHSKAYFRKHQHGFWRKLSNSRELHMARQALQSANNPASILDLPCGTGRFWETITASGATELTAADGSAAMLEVARSSQPQELVSRFRLIQTSAFDIEVPDNSVDCIFCMRFIHHVGEPRDRLRLLKELHRVTRNTLCISLWVDGNYQAWRRKRLEARRVRKGYQNRFVIPAEIIEQEFSLSGFRIQRRLDMAPLISMWRIYVLEKTVPQKTTLESAIVERDVPETGRSEK
jgi:SAM-dependent methyltransferase